MITVKKKKSRMTTIMMNTMKTKEKIIIKKVATIVTVQVIDHLIKKNIVDLNMKKKMMMTKRPSYNLVT
jgi:nitrogenase subunit NifH